MSAHTLHIDSSSFGIGFDGYCEDCTDPDYDGGWSGIEGIYSATYQEVKDWYEDHIAENEEEA